jgi:hypothetical protein
MPAIGQELLNVPFPDLVRNLGLAIAEAQMALDVTSMRLAQFMAGYVETTDEEGNTTVERKTIRFGDQDLSLLELGFTPTFYQFVDTVIEVKISISFATETSYQQRSSSFHMSMAGGFFLGFGGGTIRTTSVSASYASKYSYSAEGSSLLRTKLVVVPPPTILEERIRRLIDTTTPAGGGGGGGGGGT